MRLSVAAPQRVEEGGVKCLAPLSLGGKRQQRLEVGEQSPGHGLRCRGASCELRHGAGIGQNGREGGLIHVETYADDAVFHHLRHTVLNEYAANLAVADVNVVGPFYLCPNLIVVKETHHGERHVLAERELERRGESLGQIIEAEEQVLVRLGQPYISPLSTACRLLGGHDSQRRRGPV